jgi:hypothetical protein
MRYFKIHDLLIHLPAHGEKAKAPVEGACGALTHATVITTTVTAPGMPTGCVGASPPHTTDHCQDCTPHWSHVHHGNGPFSPAMSMADRGILKNALDEIHGKALADERDRTVDLSKVELSDLSSDEKEKLTAAVRTLSAKLGLGPQKAGR